MTGIPRAILLAAALGAAVPCSATALRAECVVLLHGLARSEASLMLIETALAAEGYRVVAVGGVPVGSGTPVAGALGTLWISESGVFSYSADLAAELPEGGVEQDAFTLTIEDPDGDSVTVKAGGPIEPARGPERMRRSPAGAGVTTSRTGAAVGSGRPVWRRR